MKRSAPLRRTEFKPRKEAKRRQAPVLRLVVSVPADPPRPRALPAARLARVGPAPAKARPKQPREENPRLLELARGQPCLFRWVRGCEGDGGTTTVACHENRLSAGKGAQFKAHDWRSAWGCVACHSAFDQGKAEYDVLDAVFAAAWARQLVRWREIAENPRERPRAKAAAAWGLERAAAYLARHDGGTPILPA